MTLLERIIVASRLSPIFARGAVQRALGRAGVSLDDVTPAGARRALPELRRAIEPFMHAHTDAVMREIERTIEGA